MNAITAFLPDWVRDLRHTADALYVVDSESKIVLWNRGAERLLGYTESEALGRTCCEVIDGEAPTGERWCGEHCAVQRALSERTPVESFDLRVRDRSGIRRDADVSIIFMTTPRGPLTVHVMRAADRAGRMDTALDDIVALLKDAPPRTPDDGRPSATNADLFVLRGELSALTRRELQILSMAAEGSTPDAIAGTLGISRYTVRNHLQSVLEKLEVHTRAEAVALAYKNGLV